MCALGEEAADCPEDAGSGEGDAGCAFVEFRSEYRAYKAHYLQTKAAAWQSTLTQNDGCEPRQV